MTKTIRGIYCNEDDTIWASYTAEECSGPQRMGVCDVSRDAVLNLDSRGGFEMTNTGKYNTGYRNTGHYNTGDYNTGSRNTGDFNTGDFNTGYRNTGNRNTGNHNTGDRHVGWFNTISAETAYYFNKIGSVKEWNDAEKPGFIYSVSPTTWVSPGEMTDEEKAANPSHETTGGYLRKNDLRDEWRKAWEGASDRDKALLKALPNFDAEVFKQITGIDVDEDKQPREITVDGVVYVRKEELE